MQSFAREILRLVKDEELEIVEHTGNVSLLRYAGSRFHQHVDTELYTIGFRIRHGKKAFVKSLMDPRKETVLNVLNKMKELVHLLPEDPYLPPMPSEPSSHSFSILEPELKEFTAGERARVIRKIIDEIGDGTEVYGSFFSYSGKYLYTNIFQFEREIEYGIMQLNLLLDNGYHTLWVQRTYKKPGEIDTQEIVEEIKGKMMEKEPVHLKPGKYTVILEPLAMFDLLEYLNYVGLSGRSIAEGFSPLKDKEGKKVFSQHFTLIDDPEDPTLLPMKFDTEGVEKKRIILIEKGVFKSGVYDRKSALKTGKKPTGHSIFPFAGFALPLNLKLIEGEKTLKELIEETEKGLLITRFHYVNVADISSLTLTGMTRDGTYLIENGEIVSPVKDMRFHQSLFKAFSDENLIIGKGAKDIGISSFYGESLPLLYRIPPVKILNFNFIQTN